MPPLNDADVCIQAEFIATAKLRPGAVLAQRGSRRPTLKRRANKHSANEALHCPFVPIPTSPFPFLSNAVSPPSRYNQPMSIVIFFMRVTEVLFFAGLVGSAIVVVISFLEDGKELFGKD